MKKRILLILILLPSIAFGQNLNGRFEGAVSREGSVQLIEMDFRAENGIQKGTYTIPEVGLYQVPLEDISVENDTLNLKFYYGNFHCYLSKDSLQITGVSQLWNPKIRLHIKKAARRLAEHYARETIDFRNNNVNLAGTIFAPKTENAKVPYAILIHGSGPQDRTTPYYVSLAHILATNGIGVLFYDKRGCGGSGGDFKKATFSELANDAASAFRYLQSRKDLNISKIGLLGTSQGGWIAPIAAGRIKECAFVVLNVGPAVTLYEQEIHRVQYSMMNDGWEESQVESALQYVKAYFAFVKSDEKELKYLEELAADVSKKSWVEYVNLPESGEIEWWRNNEYDPAEDLSNLRCPVLSLFAEYDTLVPPQENRGKMDGYLKAARVEYQIRVIPGCGHDMIGFQGLNGDSWDWPRVYWQWRKQPVEFIEEILNFIRYTER